MDLRQPLRLGLVAAFALTVAITVWLGVPWPERDSRSAPVQVRARETRAVQDRQNRLIAVGPTFIQPLSPTEAVSVNAAIPAFIGPIEAPSPFVLPRGGAFAVSNGVARECLTSAIYYEAVGQPASGQRAVAQVVLNRMRHPAYPGTVCGVVFQGSERQTGCQFTFTCDGSLKRIPSRQGWKIASNIAGEMLAGGSERSVGLATHYHADYVVPYWATSLEKLSTIGNHIFYRFKGSWGRRAAYAGRYRGGETDPRATNEPPIIEVAFDRLTDVQATLSEANSTLIAPNAPQLTGEGAALRIDEAAPLQADRDSGRLIVDDRPR